MLLLFHSGVHFSCLELDNFSKIKIIHPLQVSMVSFVKMLLCSASVSFLLSLVCNTSLVFALYMEDHAA